MFVRIIRHILVPILVNEIVKTAVSRLVGYGSTSCCISHGPCQWDRAIFDPPQLGDPWTDFHETWNIKLLPGHDPTSKISGPMSTWVVWANSQFDAWKFLSFFSFLSHANRSHFWTHPNAKYFIMRRYRQGIAFWGSERLNLKFDPLSPKKRKNWDFKLAVNGKL